MSSFSLEKNRFRPTDLTHCVYDAKLPWTRVRKEFLIQEFSIFQLPIMQSVCPPNFAETIVVKCSWKYADLPREFHINSLCNIWGANRVHYGQLENSQWQQSFWKFSILSNIPDLEWCLPNRWKIHSSTVSIMLTCRDGRRDGKGGELSSRASKMLYEPLQRHVRNRSTNQIAGSSLFSSEIILKKVIRGCYNDPSKYKCWKLFRTTLRQISSVRQFFVGQKQITAHSWGCLKKNVKLRSEH